MKHIELNNMITQRDENGFFQLHYDKEAIREFLKEVDEKLIKFNSIPEQIAYMIDNDYYYNVLEDYTMEEVEEIFRIAREYPFEFQSYMAVSKFYKDYALKTDDKNHYLETYPDRVAITALYLSQGDIHRARRLVQQMMKQNYQPATPTFLNAGRSRRGEMVSCFILQMDDTLNSIGFHINTAMQLSKIGGGVSLNLSRLRGRGEPIKGIENAASGVVPVMKLLDDAFNYANQLGQRRGAGAAYLNIFHWDVNEFLETKKINVDDKSRIQSLSIGLIVPHKFIELAEKDEDLYVFAPYSVYKAYGQHLDDMDMDVMYEELLANPKVKKKKLTKARDMLTKIAITQFESGYPYIMFRTNANKQHPLKGIGKVLCSNLC